ncbi:MAG: hypothetical protein WDA16_00275 [Candidatus Thermoplasmatota archaeon]
MDKCRKFRSGVVGEGEREVGFSHLENEEESLALVLDDETSRELKSTIARNWRLLSGHDVSFSYVSKACSSRSRKRRAIADGTERVASPTWMMTRSFAGVTVKTRIGVDHRSSTDPLRPCRTNSTRTIRAEFTFRLTGASEQAISAESL